MEDLFIHLKETFSSIYKIPYKEIYFKDLHIDHIVPLNTALDEETFIKLNHFTNLQLLYKTHNMEKNCRLDYKIPPFPITDYKEEP